MTVDLSDAALPKIASITDQERDSLTLRPAKPTDYDQLYQYRIQCGWGEERLKTYWQDPDRPLCILQISINGEERDIGMGGWILDVPEDQVIASRKTNTVELSRCRLTTALIPSLTIYHLSISRSRTGRRCYLLIGERGYYTAWRKDNHA